MGKNYFTEEQVLEFSKNKYVNKVSDKSIQFTAEFKEDFLRLYKNGIGPNEAFRNLGFNPKELGERRVSQFVSRIKEQASRPEGFERKENSSKGKKRKLSFNSKDEEIEYYKELSERLSQENEFLKKLKALENKK